uniref:Calcium-binding protein n=1 Tax=Roseihalotalea indica TaxID=2867963 RepID=A0AA49GIN4_9BACT|nr:calcium-binding protein [Tunicatimonas sp. TK19036]
MSTGEISDTIENNSIGETATIALLEDLRDEATTFFLDYYNLSTEGRFEIGGDMPLHAGLWSGINEFAVRPNYIVGTLDDDVDFLGITTWNTAQIPGGYNSDIVNSGPGNDLIYGSEGEDLIDGGDGSDSVDYSNVDAFLDVTSIPGANNYKVDKYYGQTDDSGTADAVDYWYSIENFDGNSANGLRYDGYGGRMKVGDETDNYWYLPYNNAYTVYGYGGDDTIWTYSLNDYLKGGTGSDALHGQNGNDWLEGGSGNDNLYGGLGDDVYVLESGLNYVDEYTGGAQAADVDSLVFKGGLTIDDLTFARTGSNVSISYGGNQVDLYYHNGSSKHIDILDFGGSTVDISTIVIPTYGNADNNTIQGTYSDLYGNYAAASLDDIIYGYGGDDSIQALEGNDTVYAGEGNDYVSGDEDSDLIYGENGNDSLFGDAGNDFIYGGSGIDKLYGGAGADALYGGDGNDELRGDSSSNNAGNDYLDGGAGNDKLWGANGDDTFAYESGDGDDIIYDFNVSGGDVIDLSSFTAYDDVGDLSLSEVARSSYTDTVISLGGGTITIYNVENADLTNSEFIFSGGSSLMVGGSNGTFLSSYEDESFASSGKSAFGHDYNPSYEEYDPIANAARFKTDKNLSEGGRGRDFFTGQGETNDTIAGNDGDDVLTGRYGNDALFGGAGNDRFKWLAQDVGTGIDDLYDFNITRDQDMLDISHILKGHYDPLSNAIEDFVQLHDVGGFTELSVDQTGSGEFTSQNTVARIYGFHSGLDYGSDVTARAEQLNDLVEQRTILV